MLAHHDTPQTAGSLGALLGLTSGGVTQLVDGLRRLGLVERTVDARDARVRRLALTSTARHQVSSFEAQVIEEVAPWFDDLDDAELRSLARLLRQLGPRDRAF